MATLNQIAERIAYALKDPLNVELKENIKFSVKAWRAVLIRRDVARNGMSDEFLQRIFIDLIKVDKADACNFNLDCLILRSKYEIPKPVRLNNDTIFKYVGTVDGKAWTQTEYEEIPYVAYNKFTTKSIRFAYINKYLYIFGNTKLKKGMIQAVFSDPTVINTACDEICYTDDMDFPMGEDMIQQIITGMLTGGEFKLLNPKDDEVEIDTDINKMQSE